ncbi:MAG: UDP-N-acetylmuramoyl-tripeptide--D-alanyl-D-alanine ligase [Flavobacteriales bacterium]
MATIAALHRRFLESAGVCTDTRSVTPGSLFFALKGPRFDANAFAAEALAKGAAHAVVDDPAAAADERCTLVPDALSALQQLARHHRRAFGMPVLAITGSNGKTTTKELACAVMSAHRSTLATEGNLNNHIGVPLTLLRLKPEHRFAIIEMGASKPGDIAELMRIAEPTHGLITNIGKAHLEGFGGLDGVVRTKTELYRWLAEHGGTVFVNADDALLQVQAAGLERQVAYGTGPAARHRGGPLEGDGALRFWFAGADGRRIEVGTRLVGAYNLANALAAVAVGQHFGVPDALIADALGAYAPSNSRSQLLDTGRNSVVLDAYNANPTSMEAALRNLAEMASPLPKLAVLGDMLELGAEGPAEHRRMARLCAELGIEAVFVGPLFAAAAPPGQEAQPDAAALAKRWEQDAPRGRLILLKGSRGMRLEALVPLL